MNRIVAQAPALDCIERIPGQGIDPPADGFKVTLLHREGNRPGQHDCQFIVTYAEAMIRELQHARGPKFNLPDPGIPAAGPSQGGRESEESRSTRILAREIRG